MINIGATTGSLNTQSRKHVRPPSSAASPSYPATAANRLLEPIHNRMPVILDEAGAADWMNWREPDPLSLKRLLVPASHVISIL